jgi:penicillin-binding protein 1A
MVGILLIAGAGYLFTQVPLPDKDPPLLQTTFMCSSEVSSGCVADNSIAQLSGGVNRISVDWNEIPQVVVDAVLAAEDRTFFEHGGVDPAGILRAVWTNLQAGGVSQGGSTITQQYVKNVYLTQERTITRKIKEAALAVKVERELPKQEILTRYLNTIYLGRGAYGIEAATRTYFGKDLDQITLPEAAYLAGLIRSPETADAKLPENDPKAQRSRQTAIDRRASVLDAMVHWCNYDRGSNRSEGKRLERRAGSQHEEQLRKCRPHRVGHGVFRRLRAPLADHRGWVHRRAGLRRWTSCVHDT